MAGWPQAASERRLPGFAAEGAPKLRAESRKSRILEDVGLPWEPRGRALPEVDSGLCAKQAGVLASIPTSNGSSACSGCLPGVIDPDGHLICEEVHFL